MGCWEEFIRKDVLGDPDHACAEDDSLHRWDAGKNVVGRMRRRSQAAGAGQEIKNLYCYPLERFQECCCRCLDDFKQHMKDVRGQRREVSIGAVAKASSDVGPRLGKASWTSYDLSRNMQVHSVLG